MKGRWTSAVFVVALPCLAAWTCRPGGGDPVVDPTGDPEKFWKVNTSLCGSVPEAREGSTRCVV
mgnify:CR=1 FL=1